MKFLDVRGKLKDQRGMALISVIVIFVVLVIFTTTVVAVVYSDTEFGFRDENGKKAYYAARSAVAATEKAILDRINELSTTKGAITTRIREDIEQLNDDFINGVIETQDDYDLALAALELGYQSEIDDYIDDYNDFVGKVLPLSGSYVHEVTIDGFETDSSDFNVTVTPIMAGSSIDAYRLETQATVKGVTITVAKWLGIKIGDEDSIELKALEERPSNNHIFDDAIYSYGNLKFGEGQGSSKAEVTGGITYEGDLTNGTHVVATNTPYHKIPKTDTLAIPEPASLLPVNPASLDNRGSVLPVNISSSQNGYYSGNVQWKENYQVNTDSGDVILMFTQVTTTNNYSFNVTGSNDFFIYILDSVNPGVCIDNRTNTNNSAVIDCAGTKPNAYIIIDQPVGQRDAATNTMNFDLGKNQTTLEAYIYAPYTSLEFKNNFEFTGAIVAGGFDIWNKTKITYKEPDNNPPATDPGYIENDYIIELTGAREVTYTNGSFWLKN